MQRINANTIDEYIKAFPESMQEKLQRIRSTIRKAAPDATEAISYGMPTFKHHGNLVHFAGYENHIGFYPGASGISTFKKELTGYVTSKGTIRLPLDKPLPIALIAKIVKLRVKDNAGRGKRMALKKAKATRERKR
jgi:uncharacterized protein YdhG (YjbR/CyaY superfamily)